MEKLIVAVMKLTVELNITNAKLVAAFSKIVGFSGGGYHRGYTGGRPFT